MSQFSFNYFHWSDKPTNNPILYLHGFWASAKNAAVFGKLIAADHDFYGLNLPGHENTPITNSPLDFQELVAYTQAFIETHNLTNISVIAHSMSGAIASMLAQLMPERIKNITYVSPLNPFIFATSDQWRKYFFADNFADYAKLIEMLYANGKTMLANPTFLKGLEKKFHTSGRNDPEMMSLYNSLFSDTNYQTLINIYHNNTIPSLVVLGSNDQLLQAAQLVGQFQTHLKNSQVVVMKQVGHVAIQERPEEFYGIFNAFNQTTKANSH